MMETFFLHPKIAAKLFHFLLGFCGLLSQAAKAFLKIKGLLFQLFPFRCKRRQGGVPFHIFLFQIPVLRFITGQHAADGCQLQHRHRGSDSAFLLHKLLIDPGLFRPFLQRYQLLIQKSHHVLNPVHIFCRLFQLPEPLILPHAVQADASYVLKNQTPLIGPGRQHLIHPVLPDNGQGSPPQTCIGQKLLYILQPAASFVDFEITVPAAEKPSGNGHFRGIQRQFMGRIIQHQRNFRSILCLPGLRAGKNNILRFLTPKVPHILLSQHPAYCIGYITLSAAVGSHDHRHAVSKFYGSFICKRLEALQCQTQ